MAEKIGLVAGNGDLPVLAVEALQKAGFEPVCCALSKSAYKAISPLVKTYHYSPVEILKILKHCKELEIKKIMFLGKVPKLSFFQNIHKLDLKLLDELKKMNNFSDDSIQFRLADYLEQEHGLEILEQSKYLRDLFPSEQVFTIKEPTEEEWQEIHYGMKVAKAIAAQDIGQTAIVSNRSIYAIEAIEGTDKCIQRAKSMKNFWDKNKSITVCKVAKPNQDQRFDVPTVGLTTLKSIKENGFLAFEAGETFFVNQKEAIQYANNHNIAICSISLSSPNTN